MRCLQAILALVVGSALTGSAYAAGDVETGKLRAQTCMGCHGAPGLRNAYPGFRIPKLGGQHHHYIASALKAYQAGERPHPTMVAQASTLTDEDIENIAAYFSSLAEPQSNDKVSNEKATQCNACHGADGVAPVDTNAPILAGQYYDYLERALLDYRSGERTNAVMSGFATGLSDDDIEELSKFYYKQEGLAAPDISE